MGSSNLQPPSRAPPAPSLWSLLPPDLSDLILAHLSTAEAARVKPVCRAWRACVSSPWFDRLQERAQGPRGRQRPPCLLLYNHAVKISAISPAKIRRPSPSPSSSSSSGHRTELGLPSPYVREWVGHSLSGLLCIRTHFECSSMAPTQNPQFIVGSPFCNQWAPIPNPPPASTAIALSKLWAIITTPSNHYRFWVLLLLLHTGGSLSLQVFNSELAQWKLIAIPKLAHPTTSSSSSSGSHGSGGSHSSGGSHGSGHLIGFSSRAECVGEVIYAINPETRSIVSFDVRCCIWRRSALGLPRELVFEAAEVRAERRRFLDAPPKLLQGWRGRLLLVGAARRSTRCREEETAAGMAGETGTEMAGETGAAEETEVEMGVVWEADVSAEGSWREVARVPRGMAKALAEEAGESRKAGAAMAVRYSGHADEVVVMAMGSSRAVRVDLMTERCEWLQLPDAVNCDLALSFAC